MHQHPGLSLFCCFLALGGTGCPMPSGADAGADPGPGAPAPCQAGEVGVDVGQLLPATMAETCDRAERELRAMACGQRLTLVDIGSAALSGCVQATDDYVADAAFVAMKEDGLRIVQVFTKDRNAQPITPTFCGDYVDEHAIDFDFLIDPTENTAELGLIHPLAFVVDSDGLIVDKWVGVVPTDRDERLRTLLDAAPIRQTR